MKPSNDRQKFRNQSDKLVLFFPAGRRRLEKLLKEEAKAAN
jgi:hypothetical protein